MDRPATRPGQIDDRRWRRNCRPPPERPASFDDQKAARQYGRQLVEHLAPEKLLRARVQRARSSRKCWSISGSTTSTSSPARGDARYLTEYERDAIRPHVLGNFRDLLGATAKSPAMLFYLDNWLSADPQASTHDMRHASRRARARRGAARCGQPLRPAAAAAPMQPQQQQAAQRRRGLNENYGRELMELHTLGVDGGYTQQDVIEVARAFTGWTIEKPRQGGALPRSTPRMHDAGEKTVLGHTHQGRRRQQEGEQVLDILARIRRPRAHRARAGAALRQRRRRRRRWSIARRSASTRPHGDLREVVRTIVTSPEFFAAERYRAKVKTPFEFVVSALRADRRRRRAARGRVACRRCSSWACRSTSASRRPATTTRPTRGSTPARWSAA